MVLDRPWAARPHSAPSGNPCIPAARGSGAGGLLLSRMESLRPQETGPPGLGPKLCASYVGPLVRKGSPLRTWKEAGDLWALKGSGALYCTKVGIGSMTDFQPIRGRVG